MFWAVPGAAGAGSPVAGVAEVKFPAVIAAGEYLKS
jgi:hypothetical protein